MIIVYHLGAHFTDEDRLMKCLLANKDILASEGVSVPNPSIYRRLLRDIAIKLKGKPASPEQQEDLLNELLEGDVPDRLIFSWDSFLSLPPWVLKDTLYPAAGKRVRAFSQIFPGLEAEFCLAIRNPATFLPMLYQKVKPESYQAFLAGCDIYDLRWSRVIADILESNPDAKLTVWCDEDTPLVWPEVLRAVTDMPENQPLQGEGDLLAMLMSGEGVSRMQAYMDTRPPQDIAQRRKIVSAFLDKFALPERIGLAVEMPTWTQEIVDDLTAIYEADVAQIMGSSAVNFIRP
jgi:hypothetical protein